jgi:hypothetical protein
MTDYWNIRNEFYLMQCRKIAPDNHSNRIFNLNYQIQEYSTSNNGPNIVPTQPNTHISQNSRCQLIFLFFNYSKTAFIKTKFIFC